MSKSDAIDTAFLRESSRMLKFVAISVSDGSELIQKKKNGSDKSAVREIYATDPSRAYLQLSLSSLI